VSTVEAFTSSLLADIHSGVAGHIVQGKPNQYYPDSSLEWTMWAPKGTSPIKGINAILNIIYSFIGHPLIPSYIGDMRDPTQFPKALYITMAIEIVLFTILGVVVYIKVGE
jgi:amino acid transporter